MPEIAAEIISSGFEVVKIDTDKLLEPGMWGWRIVVFDLRMPNKQLVEYYLPVEELEAAKNDGNHALFERWRNKDLDELSESEKVRFYKDQEESDRRYQQDWDDYLVRTNQNEEMIEGLLRQTYAAVRS